MLPIDIPALTKCDIGKTLSRLKKSGPQLLQEDAKLLVAKWRKLLPPLTPAPAPAPAPKPAAESTAPSGAGAKRPRLGCAVWVFEAMSFADVGATAELTPQQPSCAHLDASALC